MLARQVPPESSPRYPATTGRLGATGPEVLDPSPLIEAVVSEIGAGQDRATVAAGFHTGLGMATAELAVKLARLHGLDTVALSGGVFQNVRFSDVVEDSLVANGLKVLVHQSVPANDGGISVGQAAIAALGTRAARRGTA
jgi:hydrogenase maturation protein HypF